MSRSILYAILIAQTPKKMILPLSYGILWVLYGMMFYGLWAAMQSIFADRANIIAVVGIVLVAVQILVSFIQHNKDLKDEYFGFFR
jgi:hypothetical protein